MNVTAKVTTLSILVKARDRAANDLEDAQIRFVKLTPDEMVATDEDTGLTPTGLLTLLETRIAGIDAAIVWVNSKEP